jgi:hypothetical protein
MTASLKNFIVKHKIDIIVVASLLLLSLIVLLVVSLTRVEGATVQVTVNGTVVAEYPLNVDGVYKLNNGSNTLTIKDGVAYMTYSNCPDHVCENTGKVHYVGERIVCLPNRLTITITGDSDDSVDFVS